MLDIISRACRHPIDYSGICRVTNLIFKEKIHEGGQTYSFIFTAPKLPNWKAGQHSIFLLSNKHVEGKTWRPFSVASAPHEKVIQIGTIIPENPSSFKQHLFALKAGEQVKMYEPFGEVYLSPKIKSLVAVAGSIGITPFRAILADLDYRGNGDTTFNLIYSAREEHAYKDELNKWAERNQNINLIYTHTVEEVRHELDKLRKKYRSNAYYFLSGAPKMIESLRQNLITNKISTARIINDPFKGY